MIFVRFASENGSSSSGRVGITFLFSACFFPTFFAPTFFAVAFLAVLCAEPFLGAAFAAVFAVPFFAVVFAVDFTVTLTLRVVVARLTAGISPPTETYTPVRAELLAW